MMRALFIGLLLSSFVNAGTITGVVKGQGKAEAESAGGGKYDSKKFKFAERVDYSQLHDFVVYLDGPVGAKPEPPKAPLQVVVQKDAQFSPHILPVVVGTTVEWPNNDEIFHNAFSMSEPKPFDLGLYKDKIKKLTFDKPGRIDVFCSIHSTMHCVILVLENPFYAVADARGRYAIANVPAGTYKLKAWHERLPAQTKDIVVPENGDVKLDFTLGITGLPEY
ncbi:MAG: carboxypeptidase regulatory-like domain-containing protein [Verrucomicrobiota bacterium]